MGGRKVLFSADIRQIGPVLKLGGPFEIIDASQISNPLWAYAHAKRFHLTVPQRDRDDAPYAAFVSNIGVGSQPHPATNYGDETVPLPYIDFPDFPPDPSVIPNTDSFEDLIGFVYPDILHGSPTDY